MATAIQGIVEVKTEKGLILSLDVWSIVAVLVLRGDYKLTDPILEITIDGQVIPKPKSMENDT